MSDDYTPSTGRVEDRYRHARRLEGGGDKGRGEFNRWLAEHDREVAARALWDAAEDWAADPDSVDCETPADTRNWLRDRADQIAGMS